MLPSCAREGVGSTSQHDAGGALSRFHRHKKTTPLGRWDSSLSFPFILSYLLELNRLQRQTNLRKCLESHPIQKSPQGIAIGFWWYLMGTRPHQPMYQPFLHPILRKWLYIIEHLVLLTYNQGHQKALLLGRHATRACTFFLGEQAWRKTHVDWKHKHAINTSYVVLLTHFSTPSRSSPWTHSFFP